MVLTLIAAFVGAISLATISLSLLFAIISVVILGGSVIAATIIARGEMASKQEALSQPLKEQLSKLSKSKSDFFFSIQASTEQNDLVPDNRTTMSPLTKK